MRQRTRTDGDIALGLRHALQDVAVRVLLHQELVARVQQQRQDELRGGQALRLLGGHAQKHAGAGAGALSAAQNNKSHVCTASQQDGIPSLSAVLIAEFARENPSGSGRGMVSASGLALLYVLQCTTLSCHAAHLCSVIAAERDKQLVPRGRRMQPLHVLPRPRHERRVAPGRPVVLLRHLQLQHATVPYHFCLTRDISICWTAGRKYKSPATAEQATEAGRLQTFSVFFTSTGSLMSTLAPPSSRSVMPRMGKAAAGGRPLCNPTTPEAQVRMSGRLDGIHTDGVQMHDHHLLWLCCP